MDRPPMVQSGTIGVDQVLRAAAVLLGGCRATPFGLHMVEGWHPSVPAVAADSYPGVCGHRAAGVAVLGHVLGAAGSLKLNP